MPTRLAVEERKIIQDYLVWHNSLFKTFGQLNHRSGHMMKIVKWRCKRLDIVLTRWPLLVIYRWKRHDMISRDFERCKP